MEIHNRKYLKDNRQGLRSNATSAEATLWRYLQKSQLHGRKFRRQHSIGSYIVDFYCPSERLVVELDGQHHYTLSGANLDHLRDEYFSSYNIQVVRFENKDIFSNPEAVLERISSYFKRDK